MPEDRERPDDVAAPGAGSETPAPEPAPAQLPLTPPVTVPPGSAGPGGPVYGYTSDPPAPPFAGPVYGTPGDVVPPSWPAGALPGVTAPGAAPPATPPPGWGWGTEAAAPGPAAPPGARRGRRRLMAVGAVVLVLAVVGGLVAYLITSGPGPVPAVSPAARALLRASLAAAEKKGSFHYVSRSTAQGATQVTVGEAGRNAGKQVITIGSDTFTVIVDGTACYFQGDAEQMVNQLGLSASVAAAHNEQWISLAPSDGPYASVYAAVTTRQALVDNIAFLPHRRLGSSVKQGQRVLGITGPLTNIKVAGELQKSKGTAHLYITASKPHLPVSYSERGTLNGTRTTFSIVFSKWGKPVTVTPPTGAVPFATIDTGGGGPSGSSGTGGGPSLVSA